MVRKIVEKRLEACGRMDTSHSRQKGKPERWRAGRMIVLLTEKPLPVTIYSSSMIYSIVSTQTIVCLLSLFVVVVKDLVVVLEGVSRRTCSVGGQELTSLSTFV